MTLLEELEAAVPLSEQLNRNLDSLAAMASKSLSPSVLAPEAGGADIPFLGRSGRDVLGNPTKDRSIPTTGQRGGSGSSSRSRGLLRSLNGKFASIEVLESVCELRKITIPDSMSATGGREVDAWCCPDNEVYPVDGAGPSRSTGASGGARNTRSAGGATFAGGGVATPPSGGGSTIPGGPGITSPDVKRLEGVLRDGFNEVVSAIKGDGGASLRLAGGI